MNCGSSCGTHLQVAVVRTLCLVPPGAALAKCPENNYEWIAQSGDWLDCTNWKHPDCVLGSHQCICVDGVPTSDIFGAFAWMQNRGAALIRSASSASNTTIESTNHRIEIMGPLERLWMRNDLQTKPLRLHPSRILARILLGGKQAMSSIVTGEPSRGGDIRHTPYGLT